jgi:hypothetical protein
MRIVGFLIVLVLLLIFQVPLSFGVALSVADWQQAMLNTPTPGQGCFMGLYPSVTWVPVNCDTKASSAAPPTIGAGYNDYNAQESGQYFTSAGGQVTSMSGYRWESDSTYRNGSYSIQLNSNHYSITFNGQSTEVWEQFVMRTTGPTSFGEVAVWYWLINYPAACPTNWSSWGSDCYHESPPKYTSTFPDPKNLTTYTLGGSVTSSSDTAKFCISSTCYASTDSDYIFLYQNHWTNVEWNVFGFGGGSTASFNPGISMNLKVTGSGQFVYCNTAVSYTGEMNNLNLGNSCGTDSHSIYFSQYD